MDELLELKRYVSDATEYIESALGLAGTMCEEIKGHTPQGQPIYGPNGWKAMEEACERLEAFRKLLAGALDPVKDAIEDAQKRQDDGASEEDIHGFKYHPKA